MRAPGMTTSCGAGCREWTVFLRGHLFLGNSSLDVVTLPDPQGTGPPIKPINLPLVNSSQVLRLKYIYFYSSFCLSEMGPVSTSFPPCSVFFPVLSFPPTSFSSRARHPFFDKFSRTTTFCQRPVLLQRQPVLFWHLEKSSLESRVQFFAGCFFPAPLDKVPSRDRGTPLRNDPWILV